MIWFDLIWFDLIWFDLIWFDKLKRVVVNIFEMNDGISSEIAGNIPKPSIETIHDRIGYDPRPKLN